MKFKAEKIKKVILQLNTLLDSCHEIEELYADKLTLVHPKLQESAVNLLHYRALRQNDIRDLQNELGYLGLSRLGKAESHVMASIRTSRAILTAFLKEKRIALPSVELNIKKGNGLLGKHAKKLLGAHFPSRRVRIMVTQPSEAAYNQHLVTKMVEKGMNTARINCAHDMQDDWKSMIENLNEACEELGKRCKIAMDLGGPKIRTGAIEPGPKVMKLKPRRDKLGRSVEPARAVLWPEGEPLPQMQDLYLPFPPKLLEQLGEGDKLLLKDARGSNRTLTVAEQSEGKWCVNCFDTSYLTTGTEVTLEKKGQGDSMKAAIGELPALEQHILLRVDDHLTVCKEQIVGNIAIFDQEGKVEKEGKISCTSDEVFQYLQVGDPVLFDDGKIRSKIVEVSPEFFRVQISYAKDGGAKLKADKGINFPESDLKISGLTQKDKDDLKFVAKYADVVNVSFVNQASDVAELIAELKKLNADQTLGIILKIETQAGFNNLVEILLEAMQMPKVGVMIARGDLAIECGWENIARIQEEMLSICQAAHVPVVWATQVLENLAKKGIPTRAEITDVAMAQRAECVMLNKGPYITTAIQMLDFILMNMKDYQHKKAPMLPVLHMSGRQLEEEKVKDV